MRGPFRIQLLPPCISDQHRRVIGTLFNQSFVSLASFLTGVILGHNIPKEDFGHYILAVTLILLLTNAQSALITTPFTFLIPRTPFLHKNRYLGSTVILSFLFAVFFSVICAIFGVGLSVFFNLHDFSLIFLIVSAVVLSILMRECIRRISFALHDLKSAIRTDAVYFLVQIIGLLGIVYFNRISFEIAVLWTGFSSLVPTVIYLQMKHRQFDIQRQRISDDFRQNWSIGKWLLVGDLAQFAGIYGYPWALAFLNGSDAAATLGACMAPLYLANPIWLSLGNYLSPAVASEFASKGEAGVRVIVSRFTIWCVSFGAVFLLIMSIFGGELVQLFYGAKYAGNGLLISILALSQFVQTSTIVLQSGLMALDRSDALFKSHVVSVSVVLTFGLVLVSMLGILGAALGLVLGNSLASLYRVIAFRKIT